MKFIIFFLLIGIKLTTYAQINIIEISHYIFPDFQKGSVFLNSGVKIDVPLNYNSLTEEMIFENKGVKQALGNLETIDSVIIDNRKFIIHENRFLELIYHSKLGLLVSHKCKVKDPGKPAAYGGTSHTSSTSSYSSFLSGGQVYELQLPNGIETLPYKDYWVNKENKLYIFLSLKQLTKLFKEKEAEIKGYLKNNNVNIENHESILGLIKYIESIY